MEGCIDRYLSRVTSFATGTTPWNRGLILGKGERLVSSPHQEQPCGPPSLVSSGYQGWSVPGHETDHSPSSTTEVNHACRWNSPAPYIFMACCTRTGLPFVWCWSSSSFGGMVLRGESLIVFGWQAVSVSFYPQERVKSICTSLFLSVSART
jgi:hypothetical protein